VAKSCYRTAPGRVVAAWGIVVVVGATLGVRVESSSDSSRSKAVPWQQACQRIVAGRIDAGAQMVRQLAGAGAKSADLAQLETWLTQYAALQAERDRFRQSDHDSEVVLAKRAIKKREWLEAIGRVSSAFDTAKDPDAFTRDPWTQDAVAKALAEAETLRGRGEWAEAAGIYAFLAHIYRENREYEQMKRRCLRHARLEVIYKKEDQAKWQSDLEGIEKGMVHDAFREMGRHYVRKADFKKALTGGIENLRILAETTNLGEAFEGLADREMVVRFIGETTSWAHKIEEGPDLDWRAAYAWFEKILETNRRYLQLPESLVISDFMDGALYPLDHFSGMIWPADVSEFKKHTMGKFQGVGIQIHKEKDDDKLLVVTPLPNTPAHRAGIKAGDLILRVDDKEIARLDIEEIVRMITGKRGTTVRLTVKRGDKPLFVVPIVRDVITITSVRGCRRDEEGNWDYMIDPKQRIGYIRIDPSFMDDTVAEMKAALRKLKDQGARALILDLRFNPGGLLRTAIDVTELFLPPGRDIVRTRGQNSERWGVSSKSGAFFTKDMVVLVNKISASASEILAGALQDNRRAVVLGTRTHGKGSVQNLIPLADDTAYLKLTTALYYLPSNRCPDRQPDAKVWGVPPDIVVPLRPKERVKVVQMRRDSDIIGAAGADPTSRSTTRQTASATKRGSTTAMASSQPATTSAPLAVEDRPNIDPQAEAALLLLRVKLLSGQPWEWAKQDVGTQAGKTARAK